jgi:uncharacterized protein YdaU (DUF1376 family)
MLFGGPGSPRPVRWSCVDFVMDRPVSQPPSFQFYVADFTLSTADMDPAEVGAYVRLLCFQWEHESVPDNVPKILRIIGSSGRLGHALWRTVKRRFSYSQKEHCWRNPRLERVRAERQAFTDSRRVGGRQRAATGKRQSGRFAPASSPASDQHLHQHLTSPPISDLRTPISSTEERTTGDVNAAGKSTRRKRDVVKHEDLQLSATVRRRKRPTPAPPVTPDELHGMERGHQGSRNGTRVSAAVLAGGDEGDGRGGARPSETTGDVRFEVMPRTRESSGWSRLVSDLQTAPTAEAMGETLRGIAQRGRRRS